jgi:hypothetical protein
MEQDDKIVLNIYIYILLTHSIGLFYLTIIPMTNIALIQFCHT